MNNEERNRRRREEYHADPKKRQLAKERAKRWSAANPERRAEIRRASDKRRYWDGRKKKIITVTPTDFREAYDRIRWEISKAQSQEEVFDLCNDFIDTYAARYTGIPKDIDYLLSDVLNI